MKASLAVQLILIVKLVLCINCDSDSKTSDDDKCEIHLEYFQESLMQHEMWAIEMFDSWTKFQSGVLFGNRVDFGNYEQCLDFHHESNDSRVGTINTQHCLIYYEATENIEAFDWYDIGSILRQKHLRLGGGVCLPSSCSATRIQSFINDFIKSADLRLAKDYDQSEWCTIGEREAFKTIDIVCIVILSLLALLLLSSTIYELSMIRRNHKPNELYSAFSVYKNGTKLFNYDVKKSTSMLRCLSGLRTFAMIHIMLVHRSGWQRGFPNVNSNVFDVDGKWQRSIFSAIANVDHAIAVDTFFVIGGLLISQSILNSMEKKCFNIPKMYLHRYLRTTPVLALLILIILSILKFLGNGPYFDYFINIAFVKSCEKNWWAALLHIQNYYDPLGACLQASWYLSVDFQLVLLSPLLLYPIYKWGWKFLWLLPTYVVAIEVWAFVVSFKNKYKAARLLMPPEVGQTFGVDFYFPTHIRMGPWLIGVMMGYIFYSTKHKKVIINKYLNIAMWLLSIGTMTAILVGMLPLQNAKYPANQFANSLWIAFTRNNWGYSIAWIIFACQNGSGGVIKWFLEHPLWQPLGRMSLSFYLVHSIYQIISIGSGKVPQYFSTTNVLQNSAGDFIVTLFLATFLYLTLEQPLLIIENYIYNVIRKKLETNSNRIRN